MLLLPEHMFKNAGKYVLVLLVNNRLLLLDCMFHKSVGNNLLA